MRDCRCGHAAEEHTTGMCLYSLDCICSGYVEEPQMYADDISERCSLCRREALDDCNGCGAPLCGMCFEIGAGFCGQRDCFPGEPSTSAGE
jgi:hypothetical protein